MNQILTQTALLRRVGARDMDSWEDFFHLYSGASLIFLKSGGVSQSDAEDAVQAIMLKAPHVVGLYLTKERRGKFRHYLATALIYAHVDCVRRAGRMKSELLFESLSNSKTSVDAQAAFMESPDKQLEGVEEELEEAAMRQFVEEYVRQLKPEQQELYELWREGILTKQTTWKDLAAQLGKPASTLRSQLEKVLDALQQELNRHFPKKAFRAS